MKKSLILFWLFISFCFVMFQCDEDDISLLSIRNYSYVEVTDIYPDAGKLEINTATSIEITFSEPIDENCFKEAFSISSSTGLITPLSNFSILWSPDKKKVGLIIDPVKSLMSDTIYSININTNLRSKAGNPIKNDFHSVFATGTFLENDKYESNNISDDAKSYNIGKTIFGVIGNNGSDEDWFVVYVGDYLWYGPFLAGGFYWGNYNNVTFSLNVASGDVIFELYDPTSLISPIYTGSTSATLPGDLRVWGTSAKYNVGNYYIKVKSNSGGQTGIYSLTVYQWH